MEPRRSHLPDAKSAPASDDTRLMMLFEANKKSMVASYMLWFFVGALGGHRFYNGRTGSAIAQASMCIVGFLTVFAFGIGLLLLIALGIWLLVDAFLIPGWVTAYNDRLAHQLASR